MRLSADRDAERRPRASSTCSPASSAASSRRSPRRRRDARRRDLGRRRLAEVRRPRARDADAQGAPRRARPHRRAGGLGAPGRLRRDRARRGGRADRPERLGQVDAAPADRRDHPADGRDASRPADGSARCSSSARASIPDFTGRENVELNGALQGLSRARIRERFDEIVAFAELEHAIDRPVRTYSSGMTMRLGFAIAAFLEADVLLLDEVFAVGDESFQRKCFGVIAAFKERGGTILFVSHDASAVERLCDRAVLLRDGRARLRRPGPRGDHALPPRARRGGRRGDGERRRPVRLRRGADRRGPARRPPTGEPRDRFLAGEPLRARRRRSTRLRRGAAPPPRGAGRLRAARRRGRRRDGVARLGRRAATARAAPRRRRAAAPVRPLRARRSRCSATTAACSTGCRARSRCSSTRTTRAAGSCGSKERGGADANEAEL